MVAGRRTLELSGPERVRSNDGLGVCPIDAAILENKCKSLDKCRRVMCG